MMNNTIEDNYSKDDIASHSFSEKLDQNQNTDENAHHIKLNKTRDHDANSDISKEQHINKSNSENNGVYPITNMSSFSNNEILNLEKLLEKLKFDKEICTFSLKDYYRLAYKFYKGKEIIFF